MNYWLLKSEPDAFSIDDLMACPNQTDLWDGIRNYQARNFMMKDMSVGDLAFFYHSNCKAIGIVGVMKVVSEAEVDPTQFDPDNKYFDPKASSDKPRWFACRFQFVDKFDEVIPLQTLKEIPELSDFRLVQKGNRLSILPVEEKHWNLIMAMVKD